MRNLPQDPSVCVVIPARNEADNLREILPQLPPVDEVVLVDGNSVDATIAVAQQLRPDIKVVQQTRTGKGNALICGFEEAESDIVVMLDADCSADPAEIQDFVGALTRGADFAKGSRYLPGGGSTDLTRIRSLGNRALSMLANLLFRTSYSDLCYGYNAFWRDLLPKLDLPATDLPTQGQMYWGDGFEIETLLNCRVAVAGASVAEVPSFEQDRLHGRSNLNAVTDGLRVLRTLWVERVRAARIPRGRADQASSELGRRRLRRVA